MFEIPLAFIPNGRDNILVYQLRFSHRPHHCYLYFDMKNRNHTCTENIVVQTTTPTLAVTQMPRVVCPSTAHNMLMEHTYFYVGYTLKD